MKPIKSVKYDTIKDKTYANVEFLDGTTGSYSKEKDMKDVGKQLQKQINENR